MTVKILRSPNHQQLPSDDATTKAIVKAIKEKYLEYLNDPIDHSELMALVEEIRETEERLNIEPKGIFGGK